MTSCWDLSWSLFFLVVLYHMTWCVTLVNSHRVKSFYISKYLNFSNTNNIIDTKEGWSRKSSKNGRKKKTTGNFQYFNINGKSHPQPGFIIQEYLELEWQFSLYFTGRCPKSRNLATKTKMWFLWLPSRLRLNSTFYCAAVFICDLQVSVIGRQTAHK